MLYGAKFQAIYKLKKIYKLMNIIKISPDNMHKVLLINIAYSLTAHSPRYKLNIKDKLISLDLDPYLINKLPNLFYPENSTVPSFIFILGFFLGDGTLHLKLEWKNKNNTIVIIPLFNIVQSNVVSNKHIMKKMTDTLNNNGIKAPLYKKSKTYDLTVKGLNNVLVHLLPRVNNYCHFLFWKKDSFYLFLWVKQLVKIGGHHTYFGLNKLINKIYNNTNKRFTEKEIWINRLNLWLKAICERTIWGEYYIYAIYTSDKKIRGWQVRFPSTLKVSKYNKAFMCTTFGGLDKAFSSAVKYRDKILCDRIDSF